MDFCPLDYSLCSQVVTVYRKQGQEILRQVIEGCYLQLQQQWQVSELGRRQETTFLLIMPGETQRVFPGDRVFDGIGPEISAEQWTEFLPVTVSGLAEVAYAAPFLWNGKLCHVEAGRK